MSTVGDHLSGLALVAEMRSVLVCELGRSDHGHTSCWLASLAADELEDRDQTRANIALRNARGVLDEARKKAATALITGEHVERVAELVFGYNEDDDSGPTCGQVANDILGYVADLIAPLLTATMPIGPEKAMQR